MSLNIGWIECQKCFGVYFTRVSFKNKPTQARINEVAESASLNLCMRCKRKMELAKKELNI